MHTAHLRQADLNLLVVFTVLAEERNVSRAANRLLLSQPAVTRAMQRLRAMFHDELLVRVSGNYELTPKGESLLQELETTLPRLDRLLAGGDFAPDQETAEFRLAGFEEGFVCVVARNSPYAYRLTLDQYLEASRVGIITYGGPQTIPDQRLAASGLERRSAFRVPFFASAPRTPRLRRRLMCPHDYPYRSVPPCDC